MMWAILNCLMTEHNVCICGYDNGPSASKEDGDIDYYKQILFRLVLIYGIVINVYFIFLFAFLFHFIVRSDFT